MIDFILKIAMLDMSLAVESYYVETMFGLEDSLRSLRGERERFHHLAVTDWLTNLHNHSFSRHLLADALDSAITEGLPLCVIMADLDHGEEFLFILQNTDLAEGKAVAERVRVHINSDAIVSVLK